VIEDNIAPHINIATAIAATAPAHCMKWKPQCVAITE